MYASADIDQLAAHSEIANDPRIVLDLWSERGAVEQVRQILRAANLREAFETWLSGNQVMKRTFRTSATIAGLLERRLPGEKKSGRQATFSSDILYDTLAKYDPDHLMLRITREEAMKGLVDFGRIEEMLARTGGRVDHLSLDRVTPLAAPLLLEAGRVPVQGRSTERLLAEEAAALMAEAGLADL